MSIDTAIRVEQLGKHYRIDHQVRHDTLRDALSQGVKGLWSALRLRRAERLTAREDFWALRDVGFEVKRGEVIGVIGRNGAGKSTLLKILSRITEPTTGRIELRGRVASLLEVGTGFHPELTGRENIFLNGSILGMSRLEIQTKFDEIVAFAEVEKFLDTPVKRYSSGMYVRLAFAVAAHLEPEILIVDEVLAVGDLQFQQKCLGKMDQVSRREGRTVLLVSHHLPTVQQLCGHCLLLGAGRVLADGDTAKVLHRYQQTIIPDGQPSLRVLEDTRALTVTAGRLVGRPDDAVVSSGEPLELEISYRSLRPEPAGRRASVSLTFFQDGRRVTNLWTEYHAGQTLPIGEAGVWSCRIPKWPFRSGAFRVDIYIQIDGQTVYWAENLLSFVSQDGAFYGKGRLTNPDQGILFIEHCWK